MKKKIIIILLVLLGIALVGGIFAYRFYQYIYEPNIDLHGQESTMLYIPTGADYQTVKDSLLDFLIDEDGFDWVAEKKSYADNVKPGRYEISHDMSANALVNMLRSGNQKPVNITFNNLRKLPALAAVLDGKFEMDSARFADYLLNPETIDEYGFSVYEFPVMFLPDTYQFFWNTSPEKFTQRMKTEYDMFWTDERKQKAERAGLTPVQVSTLASIVEQETKKNDEKSKVAGVYINRVERGMLLQADPTLVFAHGDFSIKRVLNRHKKIDSPFNTYKFPGIPPGPICLPEKSSIDAVLNYENHDYIFFCAKPDYSGYHNFSKTLRQHGYYAREYRRFLNRERIYR
ncbi:MAG: endolytic transglycosylase MltG [Bacteroidota bacterium]|nr:endolytic transglycosylase MltG [Bacteroidota bacterium]